MSCYNIVKMKLYHGSNKEIVTPLYGKGRNDCDYGSGFYLCPEKDVASLWASQNEDGGYINSYKLNIDKLKILNLGHINKEDILTWITILCRFRLDNETRATAQEEISILNFLLVSKTKTSYLELSRPRWFYQ